MRTTTTYDLADGLARGLDPSPRRDVFAFDDRGARGGELSDEALVRYDSAVQVNL